MHFNASILLLTQVDQHRTCVYAFDLSYKPGDKNMPPMCSVMLYLDFIANVFFAMLVLLLNFVLLIVTTGCLDLVLNCTATLFILEVVCAEGNEVLDASECPLHCHMWLLCQWVLICRFLHSDPPSKLSCF